MIILGRDMLRLADQFVAGKRFMAVDCRGASIRLRVAAGAVRFCCAA